MTHLISETPHILVADDLAQNLQVVGEVLTNEIACDLSFATDGVQALESVKVTRPDLVLLDVMMPGMNGFEVCAALKKDPATSDIPILFLTAKSDMTDIVTGFQCGGEDYLTKPVNHAELIARVKTHLAIRRATRLVAQKNEELKRLVQILCHDLANPVGAINGFFESCREDKQSFLDAWDELSSTARRAMEIVNFVREMQGLEEGRYHLKIVDFPLEAAVEGAQNNVSHLFRSKQITCQYCINPELNVLVEPISFTNSVLSNLLTNAAKFSLPGGTVEVSARQEETGYVTIEVEDHGIGMKPALVNDIFVPTSKVCRTGTAGETSTGFGMPLVKKFIEAYGGKITVESRDITTYPDDHGTRVTLRLRSAHK